MDEFVHEYFSVDRFRKTYACTFNPMTSKDSWPHVDLGYKITKPKVKRKPGRPRKSRVKAYDEVSTRPDAVSSLSLSQRPSAPHFPNAGALGTTLSPLGRAWAGRDVFHSLVDLRAGGEREGPIAKQWDGEGQPAFPFTAATPEAPPATLRSSHLSSRRRPGPTPQCDASMGWIRSGQR